MVAPPLVSASMRGIEAVRNQNRSQKILQQNSTLAAQGKPDFRAGVLFIILRKERAAMKNGFI